MATPSSNNFTTLPFEQPVHPYFPLSASIPSYTANLNSVPYLLTTFFSACAILFTATYALTTRANPNLTKTQLVTIMWFVLSGSIHVFFEGFYVAHFADLGASQHLIGEMWKEYAFSDSRYLTRDAFVLCMESITTLVWGPGCYLCAWMIAKGHPARWGPVICVSLGQLYGDVLYYATSFFDHHVLDITYCRSEPFYFWFYFIFMNAFWIVIPAALVYQGISETTRAMRLMQRMEQGKKAQ